MLSTQAVQDTRCGQVRGLRVPSARRVLDGFAGRIRRVRIEAIHHSHARYAGNRRGNKQSNFEQMQSQNSDEGSQEALSSTDETGAAEGAERHASAERNDTVTPERRDEALAEAGHKCQFCGRFGVEEGGLATLQIHHIDRDPDGMGEHDLANLTVLCRQCHTSFHQQPQPAAAPVEITDADLTVLHRKDTEILQYLSEHGPASTGDIASGVSIDVSLSTLRERLWVLMGLDDFVESRDTPVVDKSIETGKWGLVEQIEHSQRGRIPDDPRVLVQRMEDELTRQAINRGYSYRAVAEMLGVTRRTAFHKKRRACAYDFPLDTLTGRGGDRSASASNQDATETAIPDTAGDGHQHDSGAADSGDAGESATSTEAEDEEVAEAAAGEPDAATQDGDQSSDEAVTANLQQAITALQDLEDALEAA
jgi:hypothetical protein